MVTLFPGRDQNARFALTIVMRRVGGGCRDGAPTKNGGPELRKAHTVTGP